MNTYIHTYMHRPRACVLSSVHKRILIVLHCRNIMKYAENGTYKVKNSFHTGLRLAFTVFVFCFDLTASDGTSFSLTYGSANPFGSIGFRFRASLTATNTTASVDADPWMDRGMCAPPTFWSRGDALCCVPLLFGGRHFTFCNDLRRTLEENWHRAAL